MITMMMRLLNKKSCHNRVYRVVVQARINLGHYRLRLHELGYACLCILHRTNKHHTRLLCIVAKQTSYMRVSCQYKSISDLNIYHSGAMSVFFMGH